MPRVVSGEVMLTAALTSCANSVHELPSIEATPHVGGWALSGVELAVPQAHLAGCILVPARSPDGGILIALVDPLSPGVELERAFTTNREIHPHLHMQRVGVLFEDVLVGPESGRAALDDMLVAARIALCALQVGVCEAAMPPIIRAMCSSLRLIPWPPREPSISSDHRAGGLCHATADAVEVDGMDHSQRFAPAAAGGI